MYRRWEAHHTLTPTPLLGPSYGPLFDGATPYPASFLEAIQQETFKVMVLQESNRKLPGEPNLMPAFAMLQDIIEFWEAKYTRQIHSRHSLDVQFENAVYDFEVSRRRIQADLESLDTLVAHSIDTAVETAILPPRTRILCEVAEVFPVYLTYIIQAEFSDLGLQDDGWSVTATYGGSDADARSDVSIYGSELERRSSTMSKARKRRT